MLGMKTDFTNGVPFSDSISKMQAGCQEEKLEAFESNVNAPLFMNYEQFQKKLLGNQFAKWYWLKTEALETLKTHLAGKHGTLSTKHHAAMASFTSIYKVRTMMLTKAELARYTKAD